MRRRQDPASIGQAALLEAVAELRTHRATHPWRNPWNLALALLIPPAWPLVLLWRRQARRRAAALVEYAQALIDYHALEPTPAVRQLLSEESGWATTWP